MQSTEYTNCSSFLLLCNRFSSFNHDIFFKPLKVSVDQESRKGWLGSSGSGSAMGVPSESG